MDYALNPEPAHLNFSPAGFRYAAKDCFDCFQQYKPANFSLIQYFLCCRTIELSLKAIHLETLNRKQVKDGFSHNLMKLYDALPEVARVLSPEEVATLNTASELYRPPSKAFEYLRIEDAVHAYSHFPDLRELARIADKLLLFPRLEELESKGDHT